jgi:hypothetical protein
MVKLRHQFYSPVKKVESAVQSSRMNWENVVGNRELTC